MVGRKRPRKVVAKRRGGLTLRKYSQPQEGDCRRTSTGSLCGALNSAVFMIRNGHEWAIRSGTTPAIPSSVILFVRYVLKYEPTREVQASSFRPQGLTEALTISM